jgi:hypothetical protein
MAKKEAISTFQESTKEGGLLSILSETPKDNLLSEAMNQKGSLNFNKATGESYQRLDELRKEEASAEQRKADEAEAEKPEPIEEEQLPAEEEKPESIAAADESKWYALNEEQQRYAQRQEMLERELLQERQASRQALEELKNAVPKQPENYDFDFTSPEGIRAFEERVYSRARNEFKQSQEPLLRQIAAKEFTATTAVLANKFEHFNKYFPQQTLQQYFHTAAQRFPADQLLSLDWGKELSLAYQAADYARLKSEYEKLTTNKGEEKKVESKAKEQQKADLKLVPKANAKGVATKSSAQDRLDEWRSGHSGRFGMEDISANLKREMGLG